MPAGIIWIRLTDTAPSPGLFGHTYGQGSPLVVDYTTGVAYVLNPTTGLPVALAGGGGSGSPGPRGAALFLTQDPIEPELPMPGRRGATGAPGAAGSPGRPGLNFFLQGEPGADGEPGPPGRRGPTGTTGSTGPTGKRGYAIMMLADQGEEGPIGPPGRRGSTGATGSSGAPGTAGPRGYAVQLAADPGEPGDAGPPGRRGATGPAGTPGLDGKRGPGVFLVADPIEPDFFPGPRGKTGPQGPAGVGGGSATLTALTVTVPAGSISYTTTVVDASVTATSKILVSHGHYVDTDRNDPDIDAIDFHVETVSAGSFLFEISSRSGVIGGPFKFFYLIG